MLAIGLQHNFQNFSFDLNTTVKLYERKSLDVVLPRLATRETLGLGELTGALIQHFAGFQKKHFT